MTHRNRWFTELKNGGYVHGYVSHNQMVYHTLNPLVKLEQLLCEQQLTNCLGTTL